MATRQPLQQPKLLQLLLLTNIIINSLHVPVFSSPCSNCSYASDRSRAPEVLPTMSPLLRKAGNRCQGRQAHASDALWWAQAMVLRRCVILIQFMSLPSVPPSMLGRRLPLAAVAAPSPITLHDPASATAGILASFRHYTSPDSSPPHSQWRHPEERRQGSGRLRGGWRPTADTSESPTPWWRDTCFMADCSIAALPWSYSHHRPQWLTTMQHRTQLQQQIVRAQSVLY